MCFLNKFVLFLLSLTFSSHIYASKYFDCLDSSKRYYFSINENEEQLYGWLTLSPQGSHWHPEDDFEPQLWIKKEEALILDPQLELVTYWPLVEFEKLHPFISAWHWLSELDLESLNARSDNTSVYTKEHGYFFLSWDEEIKSINWNDKQVIFTLYLNKNEEKTFLFRYPESWALEY